MSTNEATTAPPKAPSPLSLILQPIHTRLMVASVVAGLGSALTLVPLAGIAHIAHIALDSSAESIPAAIAQAQAQIWQTVVYSVVALFVGLLLSMAAQALAHVADNRLTRHLRLTVAKRLGQVPLGWFTSHASGEVKQAMQDDIGTLHEMTAHYYTTLGRTLGAVLVSLIYLLAMDWRLALVALVPYVVGFVLIGSAMNFDEEQTQAFGNGQARVNNAVVEFVNGIPVIKTFGVGGKAHANYSAAVDGFVDAFMNMLRPIIGSLAIANALMAPVAVLAVVLAAGALFASMGWIAPVDVLPFALVAPGISAPLMLLVFVAHSLEPAKGSAERVLALLETPVLEQPLPEHQRIPDSAEVVAKNVSYSYDGEHKVLDSVSFTLKPGTVTAVVGASGAGKSTLARVLLRFFDPSEGRVTLGGVDLRDLDSAELYRRIGFVLQEVRLIHASVRENIALGRPSATQQEIEDAARAANVHDRILSLPRGYDSVVGEDAQLSGGEQQRVSIARAILLDPQVLVLDEATAAADAENEVAVQEALSRFAKGRTLLVIAHRLDTVMHADRILVVEGGAIVEQGRHDQLLAQHGRYAHLWALSGHHPTHKQDQVHDQLEMAVL